jgi:predicted transcriptional regulator
MAKKSKVREINLVDESGVFATFFKKFTHDESEYDFDSLSALRKLLSNEKARILYTIKSKKPISLYSLSKILGRDFKSVCEDVKLLERFGFIEMIAEKTGKRARLKPVLSVENIVINIKI